MEGCVSSVVALQSIYRGERARNKLALLFYPLPLEIRNIVIFYMRLSYYVERFHGSVKAVIYKRVYVLNSMEVATQEDKPLFVKTYGLFQKYRDILDVCDSEIDWIRFVATR